MMKRFFEIDLIKVIVLMLMPMSHLYDEFGANYDLMYNIPEDVKRQLGLLFMNVPSLFMICLGIGIVLSRNSTPKKLAQRGLMMFLIAAILNVFRFILPYSLVSFCTEDFVYLKESFELFFLSDILPFAGFAFLFFALVKKMNIPKIVVLLFGLFLMVIQNFIPHPIIENVYMKYLTGYFIYVDETSFFPVISWLIYPIIGYFLGQKFVQSSNKKVFYMKTGLFGLIVFVTTNGYLLATNRLEERYYLFMETGFQMDLFTTLIVASTSLIALGLVYFASRIFTLKMKELISLVSSKINSIYCIHWVLLKLFWACAIVYAFKIDYNHIFLLGFVIFLISSILAVQKDKLYGVWGLDVKKM